MEMTLPVVLSVDDNDVDGALLQRAFKRAGIPAKLFTLTEGPQAFCYLNGEGIFADRATYPLPDLILLDIRMPRLSGHELLTWIRSQPLLKKTTILIFSGSSSTEDVKLAKSMGADGYIIKPTKFNALQDLVRELYSKWLDPKRKSKSKVKAGAKEGETQATPSSNSPESELVAN